MSNPSSAPHTPREHGFLHTIKEKIWHGEKNVDGDYEAAFNKFKTLNDHLHKMKGNATNYVGSVLGVFQNSNNLATDFEQLLEDQAAPNLFSGLSVSFRTCHSKLNTERVAHITTEINERVLRPIDETLKTFSSLQSRIKSRDQLHEELEYYLTKVAGLNKERDEHLAQGKSESSKFVEKFERNQQKLNLARGDYTVFAAPLIADLNKEWNNRIALIGPALQAFVDVEKQFVEIYATEISEIGKMHIGVTPMNTPLDGVNQQQQIQSSASPRPISPRPGEIAASAPTYPQMDSLHTPNAQQHPATSPYSQQASPQPQQQPIQQSTNPFEDGHAQPIQQQPPLVPVECAPGDPQHSQPIQQQETHSYNITDLNPYKSGVLKSQGEEESKRQRYEEEHKVMTA